MPNVSATNTTSSAITVAGRKVYYIDSTDAEIVEVQDGSNVKYNAFKYTLSGTPYYYVIDGEHDTWTDDLSEWGYSEVQPAPVLPEVTFANDTSAGNWITPISGEVTNINAGSVVEGYYWTGSEYQPTVYNLSKVYAAIRWLTSGNVFAGRVEFQFVNYNGTIGIKNNTSGVLSFNQAQLAACHSPDAIVVPVYDANNVAYNAFKFTANNTDYYYVLDGTQTDWTDDLAGIGYSLTPAVITAYFTNRGSSATSDTTITPSDTQGSSYYALYDASGVNIDNDSSKTYTFYKAYRYDGTEEGFSAPPEIGGRYWYLTFHVPGNGWNSYAYRVEYTVS